jgi:purine-binding chemotaxis protein CheW
MTDGSVEAKTGFVTVRTAGQLFGLGIAQVRDVFVPKGLSTVPLAPPEVAGLLNLRGRIVTAIDLRLRLGLPRREADASRIAIGIEERGELYGLLVDEVGDVLWVTSATFEANPVNLDPRWAQICAGVHRLDVGLMVVLDVNRVLDLSHLGVAA